MCEPTYGLNMNLEMSGLSVRIILSKVMRYIVIKFIANLLLSTSLQVKSLCNHVSFKFNIVSMQYVHYNVHCILIVLTQFMRLARRFTTLLEQDERLRGCFGKTCDTFVTGFLQKTIA